jgi:hypothetical protein
LNRPSPEGSRLISFRPVERCDFCSGVVEMQVVCG